MVRKGKPYQLLQYLQLDSILPQDEKLIRKRVSAKVYQLARTNMEHPDSVGGGELLGNLEGVIQDEFTDRIGLPSEKTLVKYRDSLVEGGYLEKSGYRNKGEYAITDKGRKLLQAYSSALRLQAEILELKQLSSLQAAEIIDNSGGYYEQINKDTQDKDTLNQIAEVYTETNTERIMPEALKNMGIDTIKRYKVETLDSRTDIFLDSIELNPREEEREELEHIVGPAPETRKVVTNVTVGINLEIGGESLAREDLRVSVSADKEGNVPAMADVDEEKLARLISEQLEGKIQFK